ncbi:NACHT, LRR and PYD domains-containing protein 12-like, partial [Clarias magur]
LSTTVQSSVQADGGGTVIAPALIGNQFSGPVNLSIISSTPEPVKKPPEICHGERKAAIRNRLKLHIKEKYKIIYEGTSYVGSRAALSDVYTELSMVYGHTGGVCQEHEVLQIEALPRTISEDSPVTFSNIFKENSNPQTQRTVLTHGIAGVGKTVAVQKFALDWAEGKNNEELDFVFLIPVRHLNTIMDKKEYSLFDLLSYLFKIDLKIEGIVALEGYKVLFIFDGLDESCLTLDFGNSEMVHDLNKKSSVHLLITNLITGHMLPSARIWITSRPAAAYQIPNNLIHLVTEVRGFSEDQKVEYFRKRISDQKQARKITSLVEKYKSLHIMCHIPVFCWLTVTVCQQILAKNENPDNGEAPTILTAMYINFIHYQIDQNLQKYPVRHNGKPVQKADCDVEILKLAELAYRSLIKEKISFSEKDLQEYGIDVEAVSVYSGVFTEIFREEITLLTSKEFSFVHLTLQEFLAALYVFYMYNTEGKNVLHQTMVEKITWHVNNNLYNLHKSAIKRSLKSETGHLDLFLRFLLGISLPSNLELLNKMFQQHEFTGGTRKTVQFIKKRMRDKISPEKTLKLMHCMIEMNDTSLFEEVKIYMSSDSEHQLSPAQCSVLAFLLLISPDEMEEFDLRKYLKSDEGLRRMMPVVAACKRALLSDCNLTKQSCKILLSSRMLCLTEVDLSYNSLQDAGVSELSEWLKSPNNQLQILRLYRCHLTEESCRVLSSVLSSNSSRLRELDLSHNKLQDSGVKLLSAGLGDPHCALEIL